jgi:drug/metabolite transporter (DMT)-like permease
VNIILGIFFSALLTIFFKYFEKLNINTFQAILVNYITASALSFAFADKSHIPKGSENWFPVAASMGLLFITTFIAMSITAQRVSVIICNIAAKMSLVIPLSFAFIFVGEEITLLKITAIVMAMIGVVLTVWNKNRLYAGDMHGWKALMLIAVVFTGSGLIDASFKYVELHYFDAASPEYLMMVSYGGAALAGTAWFFISAIRSKPAIKTRNILAGIALGTVNYFSFYYVLVALHEGNMPASIVFPVVNVGILVLATLLAMILFRERLKTMNYIGVIIPISSIMILILQHYMR